MPVDRIKPLKIENPATGGVETDLFPTEANPLEDYLSIKGLTYEDLDTFRSEKLGRSLVEYFPNLYQNLTYSGNEVTTVEFFNSATFINANRLARHELSYTSNNLTSEILYIYDTDGTTILRTYTWTHTYTTNNLTSTALVIT